MMRNILVTGASKGLGKGIALALGTQSDYRIFVHYNSDLRGAEETVSAIKESGAEAHSLQFNISDRAHAKEVLERTMEEHGPFYGLILNAGIVKDTAFPAMEDDDWDDVIHTNLDGFYNVVRPCVMNMISARRGGRIIAMSSVSGITGNRGQVNYSASKAGLIGAVKSLAIELAKRNITVNSIAPGLIDTGMVNEEIFAHAKSMIPMQRMGKVEEVASLAKYLLSDEAAYITRQVISVNGGMV